MKKIFLILLLFAFSCKKSQVTPCVFIQIETTTVYYEAAGDIFWATSGKPVYSKSDTLVCTNFFEGFSIEDLFQGQTSDQKTIHACVTRHYVATKPTRK